MMAGREAIRLSTAAGWLMSIAPSAVPAQQPSTAAHGDSARVVMPGDPAISPTRIQPYTNRWKFHIVTHDGRLIPGGTWTDDVRFTTRDGRRVISRRQLTYDSTGKLAESMLNIADAATFAPLVNDNRQPDSVFIHQEYHGTRVDRSARDSAGTTPHETHARLPVPVFDFFGGTYGLLFAGMPLAEGFSATFPTQARGPKGDSVEWVTARVVGREAVAAGPGKSVLAYVTVAKTSVGEFKFWMSPEAPYVIRLVVTGPRGGQEIFEMD